MSPQVGRAAFQLALFFVLLSLGVLLIVPRNSPAFVVSVLSAGIATVFLVAVVIVVRRSSR